MKSLIVRQMSQIQRTQYVFEIINKLNKTKHLNVLNNV